MLVCYFLFACCSCPNYDLVLSAQLQKNYGNLDAAYYISNVLPIVQTGDVHAAVFDLTGQFMYVSYEATNASSVPLPFNAYDRQFTRLDLNALFAEPPPL
jgi:isopenicillin-N N-acyltransferase-like protein